MQQNILISGATGTVGGELCKQLKAAGIPFRAMVRSTEQAAGLPGAVVADFDQPETLVAAMQDITHAFLLTPSSEKAEAQQLAFVAAARQAGVQHMVKLSQWAADAASPVRFLRYHAAVEAAIAASGLHYTFLRPNLFMQGILGFRDVIAQEQQFFAAVGNAAISAIDIRDIAAVALAALTQPGHSGKTYHLTGPAAITHYEMAQTLGQALGRPVAFTDVPPAVMLKALLVAGFPAWQADGLVEDYAHYARGEAAALSGDVARVLGRSPISFRTFAQDYAPAFA